MQIERKAKKATERFGVMLIGVWGISDPNTANLSDKSLIRISVFDLVIAPPSFGIRWGTE